MRWEDDDMTDLAYESTAPQLWGDLTSPAFKWSPGNPLPFADLATLKADGTYGDGNYTGGAFKAGEYVRLGDGSQAYYDGAAWQVYTPAAMQQQQVPQGPAPGTKAWLLEQLDDIWDYLVSVDAVEADDDRFYSPSMTKAELQAILDYFTGG